jgi:hypothetical protein
MPCNRDLNLYQRFGKNMHWIAKLKMLLASKLALPFLDTDPRESVAHMFQESHKNVPNSRVAIAEH